MARFVKTVEAVKYTGSNLDEVKAAASLARAEIRLPDGVSPRREIAIWSAAKSTWGYFAPTDWLVLDNIGVRVMTDEQFKAQGYIQLPRKRVTS